MPYFGLLVIGLLGLARSEDHGPRPPAIAAVAYAPDGSLLAAAGAGVVRLLNPTTGDLLDELPTSANRITALVFSSDSKLLAVADGKPGQIGSIHLFQRHANGWSRGKSLVGHKDLIHALLFHPNGKELISAGYERVIHVWEIAEGRLLRTLSDHSDSIYALAWQPGGNLFASAGADRTVKLWDAASGKRLYSLSHANDWVYTLAFSPNGQQLAASGVDKTLRIYRISPTEGTLQHTVHAHAAPLVQVHWLPDGKSLLSLSEDRELKVWNGGTFTIRAATQPFPESPLCSAVHPRGGTLAAGLYDGKLVLLDTASGNLRATPLPTAFPLVRIKPSAVTAISERVVVPATVVGSIPRPGTEVRFELDLNEGQELGVQATKVPGSQLDPHLQLICPAGTVVTQGRAGLLGYRSPAAGRYTLVLRDQLYRGGGPFSFHLKVGPLPIVTTHFPLAVQRGTTRTIELAGVNLGGLSRLPISVPANAEPGSRVPLPVHSPLGPALNPPQLLVGEFPDLTSALLTVPGAVDGRLLEPNATTNFTARAGQPVLIEVHAERLGSPLDAVVEILDADRKPVPRAILRATATAYTTLRDHDATVRGIRFEAMDGFAMGDFVWMGGELLKIDEMPRNPDDDCHFHSQSGRRLGWLGTTPQFHALGTPAYRVDVLPPTVTPPPGGLPTFTLNWENDDGGPGYGKDSYLAFTPPHDGDYKIRVRDALGRHGPEFTFRLTVRPPRPDFRVSLEPRTLAVPPGQSQALYISAHRLDEFDGPIELEVVDLPPGWSCPSTFIGPDVQATAVVLSAPPRPRIWWGFQPKHPQTDRPPRLIARANIAGKELVRETLLPPPTIGKPGDLRTWTHESQVTLKPGGTTTITVAIERRNQFAKRVPVEVRGLPYGVRVEDVGLNGVLITETETQRTFTLFAEPWVQPQEKPLAIIAKREGGGEAAAPSVSLRIEAQTTTATAP